MTDQSTIPPMFRIEWIWATRRSVGARHFFTPCSEDTPNRICLALAGGAKKPVAYLEPQGKRFVYFFQVKGQWTGGDSNYATLADGQERTRQDIASLV